MHQRSMQHYGRPCGPGRSSKSEVSNSRALVSIKSARHITITVTRCMCIHQPCCCHHHHIAHLTSPCGKRPLIHCTSWSPSFSEAYITQQKWPLHCWYQATWLSPRGRTLHAGGRKLMFQLVGACQGLPLVVGLAWAIVHPELHTTDRDELLLH